MKTKLLIFFLFLSTTISCKNEQNQQVYKITGKTNKQKDRTDSNNLKTSDTLDYLGDYFTFENQLIFDNISSFTIEYQAVGESIYIYDFRKHSLKELKKGEIFELIEFSNAKSNRIQFICPENIWIHSFVATENNFIFLCYNQILIYDKERNYISTIPTSISWDFGKNINGNIKLLPILNTSNIIKIIL